MRHMSRRRAEVGPAGTDACILLEMEYAKQNPNRQKGSP